MENLFSGLDAFGLNNLSNMSIYEDKEKEEKVTARQVVDNPTFAEEDIIFDKHHTCPVCDREFKSKMVRAGKIKLLTLDTDLRPKYQSMDPLKYDAILCPHCGYAALNRFFNYISNAQAKLVKINISAAFRGIKEPGDILTYDDAIARHKMALLNAVVKKAKISERAYTCLKTAWIIRGKAETLPKDTQNYDDAIAALNQEERDFLSKAYEGFEEAFMKETFPMCGMDEHTMTVLMADLARKLMRYGEAGRWISKALTSRTANERIKAKAREIKDMIKEVD